MTFEGHVKSVYGELMFQVTALTVQLDAALAEKAKLEAKIKEMEAPQEPKKAKAGAE